MDRQLGDLTAGVPSLDPGVTVLCADERATGHHRLVLAALQADRGPALWIDAGDTANTYVLHELTSNRRLLDGIRVARAWTAYQHHSLVRRTVDRASARTRLVVAPNVDLLYRADDVPEAEATWLLEASMATLAGLAEALSIPVLLTSSDPAKLPAQELIEHELDWERTSEGETFTGTDGQTRLYRGAWWWQTTIPYWVDLVGTERGDRWEPSVAPGRLEPAIIGY